MVERKKLNIDVPGAISDFEEVVKEFELKEKLYRIIFRGKGLEFDKYRDYSPDEDASNIDWKASLRSNKLIAKQYIEERDLNIVFVVDVSENMLLGSSNKLKCEYVAEIFIALSHLMISSNDKVGLVLYSNGINKFFPPRVGKNNLFFLIDVLSNPNIYGGVSRFDKVVDFLLDYLSDNMDGVIILSDFLKVSGDLIDNLFLVSNKFETMAIMVKDMLDKTFPDVDREIVLEDPISGQQILVNPKMVGKIYEKKALEGEKVVKSVFRKSNIDLLELVTNKKFSFPLAEFLKSRVDQKRGVI